jgi:hypothetical protein
MRDAGFPQARAIGRGGKVPNRILKESICASDSVDRLTWFEEVFFYRLIVNCDDFGRMDARSAILKARLFPLKNVTDRQIENALCKLATVGIVSVYEYDGKPFLQFSTWERHQQIRAKKSKFPAPDDTCKHLISDDCKCPRNPIQSNPNPIVVDNAREDDDGNNLELPPEMRDNDYAKLASTLDGFFGRPCTSMEIDTAEFLIEQHGKQWFEQALRESSDAGAKNLAYVRAKLDAWKARGSPEKDRQAKGQEESRYKPL